MATVEQLKQEIAEADAEVARLTPAFNQAKTAEISAQAALDAFYARPGKVSLNQLSAARTAATANPSDAAAQRALQDTQAQWNAQQSEFTPLLQARDNAAAATIAARTPIVAAEDKAAQADLNIARIDPTQASPDAVQALKEQTEGTPAGGVAPTENTNGTTSQNSNAQTEDSPNTSATNPSGVLAKPYTEANDDGSTTTYYEDGSTLTENADGTTSATDAPTSTTTTDDPTSGPVSPTGTAYDDDGNLNPGWSLDEDNNPVWVGGEFVEPATKASADQTRQDQSNAETSRLGRSGVPRGAHPVDPVPSIAQWAEAKDLRVKLRVPPDYLVGPSAGPANIIQKNGGILFPYTPTISLDNQASYATQNPLHSNFPLYFYKNSSVGPIQVTGKFTVQNEFEGAVLLGTIHLLRSLIKMKFGDDPDAGSPPPVCRFDAYGDYMLNNVPVSIASWRHELPDGVDYIAVGRPGSPMIYGHSMVPVLSTISLTLNVMYSRREMLAHNVGAWNSGNLRGRGYI